MYIHKSIETHVLRLQLFACLYIYVCTYIYAYKPIYITGPDEYPDPRAPRTSMLRAPANLRVWSAPPPPLTSSTSEMPPPHQIHKYSHLTDDELQKRFLISSQRAARPVPQPSSASTLALAAQDTQPAAGESESETGEAKTREAGLRGNLRHSKSSDAFEGEQHQDQEQGSNNVFEGDGQWEAAPGFDPRVFQ